MYETTLKYIRDRASGELNSESAAWSQSN